MRKAINKDVMYARIAKRFHRLHQPLVDMIQCLQDAVPSTTVLGSVELTQTNGYINISYTAKPIKPIKLVINDGKRKFTLKMEEPHKKV